MSEKTCAEVQELLPAYCAGDLGRVRRSLVAVHLRRCDRDCQSAFSKQRDLAAGLRSLAASDDTPPEGLLEQLLAQTDSPRGAGALRGAVSGAKPAYSAALLLAGAVTTAGAGYASWLSAKHLRKRLRR